MKHLSPASTTAPEGRLHIAHLVYSFRVGGLENGLVNLINQLPDDKVRHSIICLRDYDETFVRRIRTANVDIYALNKRPGQDFAMLWRWWCLLRKLQPAVVHSRNLATLECQALSVLLRVPLRIHGEHGWDMADLAGNNTRYLWFRRLLKAGIHHFVALSREGMDYLQDQVAIAAPKISHICNGVDTERFKPGLMPVSPPPELAIDRGVWIGTVGRMAEVKNQRLLAEAFIELLKRLPQQAPRLRLMLVGEGEERLAIDRRLRAAGVISQVWLTGERDDIPALLNSLDIFVLPSLAEGISNTLLEAMACGLPVIATAVGGNSDLIESGHTGYLVPSNRVGAMAEALARYVCQPQLLQRHGSNARARVLSHYSLSVMVSAYARLYGLRDPPLSAPLKENSLLETQCRINHHERRINKD